MEHQVEEVEVKLRIVDIVIPVLNESMHIRFCLQKIQEVLDSEHFNYRIILVDDGSTDTTWSIISEISEVDARIVGIRLSRNFGKEAALAAGL